MMLSDRTLFFIAFALVIFSVLGAGLSYFVLNYYQILGTGFVTSGNGTVNISVSSTASINFTTDSINWGSGQVNSTNFARAVLDTSSGNVINGTWNAVSSGFVIENIGNVNITLDIASGKNATQFLGGTQPFYRLNVTNLETDSCLNSSGGSGGLNLTTFLDVNITSPGTRICGVFQYLDPSDRLRVDVQLGIPFDSTTGTITDTITATVAAV